MSRNAVSRIVIACCLASALAACGSGNSAGPSGSPKTSPPAVKPANLAALNKIVLQPADLPAGWKGTPYHEDPTDAAGQAALIKCVGARNTDPDKVADANSDDYDLGDASISSSATSYRSQSDLDVDIAIVHSPKLSTCYDRLIRTQLAGSLPAGTKITSVTFKITPGSAGGPANVLAMGNSTISVKVGGQEVQIYLTVAFITGPLIEAEVDAENIGSPVPADLVNSLVTKVATRAAKG